MEVHCSSEDHAAHTTQMNPRAGMGSGSSSSSSSEPKTRALVCAVLITQVLSIALATTGVSSQALTNQGVYAPTTQAFLNYCLLALVFGTVSMLLPLIRYKQDLAAHKARTAGSSNGSSNSSLEAAAAKWARLRRSWPSLAALALIDVEANVLVTRSYQYTSLTSVTLLDCFTIPVVMLLSWLLLRARYKPGHYIGAVCCIAGLAVLVLGDSKTAGGNSNSSGGAHMGLLGLLKGTSNNGSSSTTTSSSSSGSYPLLGDSLVLLGAVLYGVCNVTQELLLSDVEPGQLLALLGAFGALISGAQAVLLEHQMLLSVHWGAASVYLPMAGFAAAMFAFYSLVPSVLLLGGATVLNLGLLTSDGWAALARSLWFGGFPGWSGYVFAGSLVLVACGLVLYTLSGSPTDEGAPDTQGTGAGLRGGHQGGAAGVGQGVEYSRLQAAADDVEGQQGAPCHLLCPDTMQGFGRPPERGSQ